MSSCFVPICQPTDVRSSTFTGGQVNGLQLAAYVADHIACFIAFALQTELLFIGGRREVTSHLHSEVA